MQRNISVDDKTGLDDLEEATNVIDYCRSDWLKLEEKFQRLTSKENLLGEERKYCKWSS